MIAAVALALLPAITDAGPQEPVVLAIDGKPVANLRAYSEALRSKSPGDVIKVHLRRGDEELDFEATLVAR